MVFTAHHVTACICCNRSFDERDPNYASQEDIFNDLGRFVLDNAMKGYNCSVFAYGQTGSGKSYTMMGTGTVLRNMLEEELGLIPRICRSLFSRFGGQNDGSLVSNQQPPRSTSCTFEVSYLEIYNERVRDLFHTDELSVAENKGHNGQAFPNATSNTKGSALKVREHPEKGVYVENLVWMAVTCYEEVEMLLRIGSRARTVAATNMNEASSRSHAVFQLLFRQGTSVDESSGDVSSSKHNERKTKRENNANLLERVSKICLVDLAGSERTG